MGGVAGVVGVGVVGVGVVGVAGGVLVKILLSLLAALGHVTFEFNEFPGAVFPSKSEQTISPPDTGLTALFE